MCAGLSAVHFANVGMWGAAIASIAAAAVLDGLDGRIARLLDATSKMGAELDSLADAISFGVAPALVIYLWKFEGSRAGWVIALIFAVCMVRSPGPLQHPAGEGTAAVREGVLRRRARSRRRVCCCCCR